MNPHDLPDIRKFRLKTPLQIRFNDIDILGHLNNTVYFSLYDTGKAYYLEAVKGGEINWRKVESVIANIDCAFIKPILFGEEIYVYTRCVEIREKSFRLQQVIVASEKGREADIRSVAETVMVVFDPETKISMPVSDELRKMLCRYEGRDL